MRLESPSFQDGERQLLVVGRMVFGFQTASKSVGTSAEAKGTWSLPPVELVETEGSAA